MAAIIATTHDVLVTLALGLVGLLMLQAKAVEDRFYVDAALGLALFSFVGTVVFARFLERGDEDD